jgi:hypothetical protein
VFSIIFEKPFIVIGNEKRGIDRFISLLDIIDMRHRMITDVDKVTEKLINEKIDFNSIQSKLSNYKEISKNYLNLYIKTSTSNS